MGNILECRELSKNYGTKHALTKFNLTLDSGKILGLLGPNGSGKTTFIKLVAGLLQESGGQVLIDGQLPGVHTKNAVSYLPDCDFLEGSYTVEMAVNYYADFYENFNRGRATAMLTALNLDPKARIRSLSKGMREKVALMLVMSREAKLYLLDEPIAGVDPVSRDEILRTIISNYAQDSAMIISTHLVADVENVLSDVLFMRGGVTLLQQSAESIREQHGMSIDMFYREVYR